MQPLIDRLVAAWPGFRACLDDTWIDWVIWLVVGAAVVAAVVVVAADLVGRLVGQDGDAAGMGQPDGEDGNDGGTGAG